VADTGLPWELPYPLPTDLVRDGADAIKDLAEATADGLDDASLIKQVVQTVKTDTFSTTSASYVNVTGLSVSITPSSTASKVLIIAQISYGRNANAYPRFQISGGGATAYIGDASSSRSRAIFGGDFSLDLVSSNSAVYLDSPATTSSVTYNVQVARGAAGTAFVNRAGTDFNGPDGIRGASSITVIEVAA
jgi:hypothetical protein